MTENAAVTLLAFKLANGSTHRGLRKGHDPFDGPDILAAHRASLKDKQAVIGRYLFLRRVGVRVHSDDHLRLESNAAVPSANGSEVHISKCVRVSTHAKSGACADQPEAHFLADERDLRGHFSGQ